MTDISFFVPGLVCGKGRPRFNRKTGRAYTPEKTVAYESLVALAAHDAMDGEKLIEGPVGIVLTAVFQIPASWSQKRKKEAMESRVWHTSRPDGDNIIKVCDALNGIVWRDDAQIGRCSFAKYYGDTPGLHIFVESL